MSIGVGLSGPSSVGCGSGSGSRAAETPSMTSLLYSGCFANLKIAADKLLKGAAALTDLNSADDILKKLREHILLFEEKLPPNAFNEEANLIIEEKLWEGVESEFLSTMNLCDQLTETLLHLQCLADRVQDVGEDKDCFEVEMSTSLGALGMLKNRLKNNIIRLKWAVRNSNKGLSKPNMAEATEKYFQHEHVDCGIDVIGSSIIDIKTNNMFRSQLNISQMTNSLVVILFYKGYTRTWKTVLLPFADLTDYYWVGLGNKISFLTVDVKLQSIRKMFKVKNIPTAVVIKGDDREEVGRINKRVTVSTFITRLKKILDDWVKCHYGAEVEDLNLDDDCFY